MIEAAGRSYTAGVADDQKTRETYSDMRSHLLFAAQVATLASGGAFLVSAVLNYSIFSNWHINYLQVASPSDVVMGGFDLLIRSWPVLFGIGAGYVSSKWLKDVPKIFLVLAGASPVLGFIINTYVRDVSFFSLWREIAGFVIVGAIWYWSWGVFTSASKAWDGARIVAAANAAFACATIYTIVSMTPGFWAAGTLFVSQGANQPCARPIVLWSGSSAVVVECPDHRRIIRTDGQQFVTPGPASDQALAWLTDFLRNH